MMQLQEGKIFEMADTEEVLKHLSSRKTEVIVSSPGDLKLVIDKSALYLDHKNSSSFHYPVRRSFLFKLLSWHKFPKEESKILSDNTLLLLSNELLNSISAKEVSVDIEDNEALSIKSLRYSKISDLEVYQKIKDLNITKISKNDLMTRFYTEKKYETDPIPGDYCGFGLNLYNSETGFSSLKVEHYILRYFCSNGASAPIGLGMEKKYHFNTNRADMFLFIEQKVNSSSPSREQLIKRINESQKLPSVKYIQDIQSKLGSALNGRQAYDFIRAFDKKLTKYDFFNYITDNAKNFDIYKKAQLEKIAGELILSN